MSVYAITKNIISTHHRANPEDIVGRREFTTQEELFNRRLVEISSYICLDVVLRDGKFYRNINSNIYPQHFSGGGSSSIILPFSERIDIDKYHLIKTVFCDGVDFIINNVLIEQLPNLKTLYLENLLTENIFNNTDLLIESLYIIGDRNRNQDYSHIKNLKFLYIQNHGNIVDFSHIPNIETLYFKNIYMRGKSVDLTHLISLKNLTIDSIEIANVDNKINLSNLPNLEYICLKGDVVSSVNFSGLLNIKTLDVDGSSSRPETNSSLSFLLPRLQHLITLKYPWCNEQERYSRLRGVKLKYLVNWGQGIVTREEMLSMGINIRE